MVRCTAEGIERGMLMGVGREGGEATIFSIPERFKVVALTACVMCLCNADRVVMSVAVVPLAAKYGWSSSFLGVVQVTLCETPLLYVFIFANWWGFNSLQGSCAFNYVVLLLMDVRYDKQKKQIRSNCLVVEKVKSCDASPPPKITLQTRTKC